MRTATAVAHPNIALVKYWGKRDLALNLPAVPSLSLTLDRFATTTTVRWGARVDRVVLDGQEARDRGLSRVLAFLDLVDPQRPRVEVVSASNFPVAAGLASSSSAFAALAVAATAAAGHKRTPSELSALARRGSGSASRSLFGGFVRWHLGTDPNGSDSVAEQVAAADHWDLSLVVAVVSSQKKKVGSTQGMERSRLTSPYYAAWVREAPAQVDAGIQAVLDRDLPELGRIMEASTLQMHATMHTSAPPIVYWQAGTVASLQEIWALRDRGIGAWATMDAGPNVKVLCHPGDAEVVASALGAHCERVEILGPGSAPELV